MIFQSHAACSFASVDAYRAEVLAGWRFPQDILGEGRKLPPVQELPSGAAGEPFACVPTSAGDAKTAAERRISFPKQKKLVEGNAD
jgi:hypothetical protein